MYSQMLYLSKASLPNVWMTGEFSKFTDFHQLQSLHFLMRIQTDWIDYSCPNQTYLKVLEVDL